MYRDNELYLSEREQIFDVGATNQIIVLPSEVDKVLACRRYATRLKVKQEDMRPRYRSMGWAEPYLGYPYLTWRFKNRYPLKKEFLNLAPFTYTIGEAATVSFTLTITGKTNAAAQTTDVVTFATGDTTKVGVKLFTEYFSIQKSIVIDADVVVTDADANEVAVIPNNILKCDYPYYQILDRYESSSAETTLVEVLYKLSYTKLVLNTDSLLSDIYDKAIYWKTAASYYAKKPGEDSLTRAAAYGAKSDDILKRINQSYMRSSTSEIIYTPQLGTRVLSVIRAGLHTV